MLRPLALLVVIAGLASAQLPTSQIQINVAHGRDSGEWVQVGTTVALVQIEPTGPKEFAISWDGTTYNTIGRNISGITNNDIMRGGWNWNTTITYAPQRPTFWVKDLGTGVVAPYPMFPPVVGTKSTNQETWNWVTRTIPGPTLTINRATGAQIWDNPYYPPDSDGDGIIDAQDPDDDNDGQPDAADPDHPSYQPILNPDGDNDGRSDDYDLDDDGDGINDIVDPDHPDYVPPDPDTDGDGTGNLLDDDDDGDGIVDGDDSEPLNPDAGDEDGDGIGDNRDPDDDNDGIPDDNENQPEPPSGTDTDGDGKPDSIDPDDDNDGAGDDVDTDPRNPPSGGGSGGSGGGTGSGGGGGGGGAGTPPEGGGTGDAYVGGMNALQPGDAPWNGDKAQFGQSETERYKSGRENALSKIKGFAAIQWLRQGTLPKATAYNLSIPLGRFGTMARTIDLQQPVVVGIRYAWLLVITFLLGQAFLKRVTI